MRIRTMLLISACGLMTLAAPAAATTIHWAQWSQAFTTGTAIGSATAGIDTIGSGTVPNILVSYSGEVVGVFANYPSWNPASTFNAGGLNAPPQDFGSVRLYGGLTSLDTVTFSTPVTDPYFAIWSLGSPSIPASFVFTATPVLDSGGPSAEYGGTPITLSGNTVSGREGNGVVHFTGTFSSISWINPNAENYYVFTVGVADVAGGGGGGSGNPGVPEPMTLALFGMGLAGLAALRRRKH